MINKERLEQAINIMKRAGTIDMTTWQGGDEVGCAATEAELHSCGNSACFAGWVAIAPEFKKVGGKHLSNSGAPIFDGYTGYYAISEWLEAEGELHKEVIELLVTGEGAVLDSTIQWLKSKDIQITTNKHEPDSLYTYVHLNGWRNYKAHDVIKILEALRD